MGKYAATRVVNRDRQKKGSGYSLADTASYLLDRPTDQGSYELQSFIGGYSRLYGAYYQYRDNSAYMRDYLKNTGLSYSDLRYPARTIGFGSSGNLARVGSNYVSDTVKLLYAKRR